MDDNFQKKPNKLLNAADKTVAGFVYAIIGFLFVSIGIMMFAYILKYSDTFSIVELLWLPVAAAYMGGLYFLAKWLTTKSEWLTVLLVLGGATLIYLILLLTFDSQPASDWGAIWQQAQDIAAGTFDGADKTGYLYFFNWQIGMASFEALLIKIFGVNFAILKVINVILLNLISYLTYLVAKKTVGKTAAVYAFVFTAFFIPYLVTAGQFTNHQVSLVLILAAVLLINKDRYWTVCVAGALLAVLNVFRPMAIVIIVACVCYAVYKLIRDKRKYVDILIKFALLTASFVIVLVGFNTLFIELKYTDMPVSSARLPYFKFDKGLNGYTMPMDDLEEYNYDYDAYNEWQKQNVAAALKRPLHTTAFVAKKMINFAGTFDWEIEMSYNHDQTIVTAYPVKAMYSTGWFTYLFIVVAAGIGYYLYRKQSKGNIDFLTICFIGLILVYIFIEAFSSYRFEAYPFLLIMAGYFAANIKAFAKIICQKFGKKGSSCS